MRAIRCTVSLWPLRSAPGAHVSRDMGSSFSEASVMSMDCTTLFRARPAVAAMQKEKPRTAATSGRRMPRSARAHVGRVACGPQGSRQPCHAHALQHALTMELGLATRGNSDATHNGQQCCVRDPGPAGSNSSKHGTVDTRWLTAQLRLVASARVCVIVAPDSSNYKVPSMFHCQAFPLAACTHSRAPWKLRAKMAVKKGVVAPMACMH